MTSSFLSLATLSLAVTLVGCAPTHPATPPEKVSPMNSFSRKPPGPRARALLETLASYSREGKIALGHQDAVSYGVGWRGDFDRSDVKGVCGRHPKVLGFDLGHLERGDEKNLDGVPFENMRKNIAFHATRGSIVTVSWHMRNLGTGGDAWDTESEVDALLPGGAKHERLTAALDRASAFLASLKDESGAPVPVLLRPYHEHNGDWFWWGKERTSEASFVSLFRFTIAYLTNARGHDELAVAISPSAGRSKAKEDYLWGYPGDEFVDVLGLDEYHGHDPSELVTTAAIAVREADSRGKIAAITEFGPIRENYDDAPNWLLDSFYAPLLADRDARRVSYALAWRNDRPTHAFLPYPGHPSANALRELCENPNLVLQARRD